MAATIGTPEAAGSTGATSTPLGFNSDSFQLSEYSCNAITFEDSEVILFPKKDFQEFLRRFKTDDDCWEYLFSIRWSNGFVCPVCKSNKYYLNKRKLVECNLCGHQISVTAGTIFHGTRKPLLLWFHVMWWVAAQKTGVSASNFKDFMGFGSYETAWAWLHTSYAR